jgi:hypothetical protein
MFLLLTLALSPFAQHHGHQMPTPVASPTPAATPTPSPANRQMHRHSPVMEVPDASTGKNKTNRPASPSQSATGHMHGKDPGLVDTDSLIVMNGDQMGIRIGSSDTNVISMGAMGSGTSWQPSSGPMHMHHWTKGDWLLMFHYNLFAGVNRQGGPRGVTKFESTNWFMTMAYHKLGKGTLQLRGMFSTEQDELLRKADRQLLGIREDHPSFRIGAYTFGGVRDLWTTEKIRFAIGSDLTFYSKPALLDTIYGKNPISWKLFSVFILAKWI